MRIQQLKYFVCFEGKEYEIIEFPETYKNGHMKKYVDQKDTTEDKQSKDKFEILDCYERSLPVLYLKEIIESSHNFAIISYPVDAGFDFCFLKCNESMEFEELSITGNLVLVYWNVHFKWFEEALKLCNSDQSYSFCFY